MHPLLSALPKTEQAPTPPAAPPAPVAAPAPAAPPAPAASNQKKTYAERLEEAKVRGAVDNVP